MQGLLPDNNAVRSAWGKRFQVPKNNPYDLIKHVAEEILAEWDSEFIKNLRDLILDRVVVCRKSMILGK
ncbi:MAG: hypothetical protein IZT59_14120 [Verrucomicrobia bacterium]|nr:hypothetical protein [Verrucomicrobiota bacterium]